MSTRPRSRTCGSSTGPTARACSLDDRVAAFDRWIAAHDAEIRAEALAPIRAALDGHPVCDVRPDGGIPSCGWKRAVADVRRALDA